jgi:hypothetical protein
MLHTACSLLLLCTPPVEVPDSIVAIVDVTVVPMDRERTLPGQTVLIRGDRIEAIGPADRVKVPAGGLGWTGAVSS